MIVFYLIGLMFATLGTYLWIDAYQFRNRARTIKGKIFSYDSKPYKNGHMYTLVI